MPCLFPTAGAIEFQSFQLSGGGLHDFHGVSQETQTGFRLRREETKTVSAAERSPGPPTQRALCRLVKDTKGRANNLSVEVQKGRWQTLVLK
ncbi:Spermatogenesis-associated protein 6 [Manis javanica]|nr:Spermatogenesis-associated protein 6 [Manis javanica]